LKSDYRYSAGLIYNNFPWPGSLNPQQHQLIESAAQEVLDARQLAPNASLADLYDPLSMPPQLTSAHALLDRAVDRSYRKEPFVSDRARVEYLFQLYEQITSPLFPAANQNRRAKGSRKK
jgi:hypothetical protein